MIKDTAVYLLKTPLEKDYKHTLYFDNKQNQLLYFQEKIEHSFTDFSYQRKDNVIRVPAAYDDILNCNYVMYKNKSYNNKMFFAFITDIKYVQPDRTDIYIETDCMQTWMFDYHVMACFVEREHVNDDTPGIHTFPEQLETGDYIVNSKIPYKKLTYRGYVVGATTDLTTYNAIETADRFKNLGGELYNGIYSGIRYFYFDNTTDINTMLQSAANDAKSDTITSIFMVPKEFVTHENGKVLLSANPVQYKWSESTGNGVAQTPINKPDSLNGYTPKNKKLLTYPYSYLMMSNNAGGAAIYKYELFKNESLCDFNINFAITPGCSIRLIPFSYNGSPAENNEEGLTAGKLPSCSWTTDVYTNWLTQNAINYPVKIASGALQTVTGAFSGGMSGAGMGATIGPANALISGTVGAATGAANGLLNIASTIGEKYQHSLQPPQAEGNLNSGDVSFANGDLTFTAYQMSIKAEYARIIDGFFDMYGYKVNRVKVPNKNHREYYWYTKTIDANIDGNIPQEDLQTIKNVYNTGITFWRDANVMGSYVNNPII